MAEPAAGGKRGRKATLFSQDGSVLGLLIKVLGLSVVVGLLTYTGWRLLGDGNYGFAAAFFITALLFTLVFVRQSTVPLRWIMPGLVFLILFQLYPIFFTVNTAFTNSSTGRNVEKPAAIAAIERLTYVPRARRPGAGHRSRRTTAVRRSGSSIRPTARPIWPCRTRT